MKRGGGWRYYRPEDLALLRRIHQCLYEEGYTIRGARKRLKENEEAGSLRPETSPAPTLFPVEISSKSLAPADTETPAKPPRAPARRLSPIARAALAEIRRELLEARQLLQQLAHLRAEP